MTVRSIATRWVSTAAIVTAITAITIGIGSSARAEGEDACTAESFELAAVEAACKQGGRPAAKALMKKAVKKAKAAGESMTCKSCHSSMKTFTLTSNAVSDLEPWL